MSIWPWKTDEEMPICKKNIFINWLLNCTILIPYIVKYKQVCSHQLFELVKPIVNYFPQNYKKEKQTSHYYSYLKFIFFLENKDWLNFRKVVERLTLFVFFRNFKKTKWIISYTSSKSVGEYQSACAKVISLNLVENITNSGIFSITLDEIKDRGN